MKKIIAFVIAAVMILTLVPMTVGAEDIVHPIVKDVVEFNYAATASDSYFALGSSLYDAGGNCIFTLGDDDEFIHTIADNCLITICTNAGSLGATESIEDLEIAFNVYGISGGEVTLKSSYAKGTGYVLPYDGEDYTAVVKVDFVKILLDPEGAVEDPSKLPLYGYEIINSYGDVVYSETGTKYAIPVGNGVFIETDIVSAEYFICNIITVTSDGVEKTVLGNDIYDLTELGDIMVTDEFLDAYGVRSIDGKVIVPTKYDDITVSNKYYIAYETDEETYEIISSNVYDRAGNLVYKITEEDDPGSGAITYYNGDVVVFECDVYGEIGVPVIYHCYVLMYASGESNKGYVGDEIYEDGDYIICQGYGDVRDGCAIFDLKGNVLLNSDSLYVECVDTANSTVIVTDEATGKTYRLNSDMEVVETLTGATYYAASCNNVTVATVVGEETADVENYLIYKGQKISRDHDMFYSCFEMGECEVWVFADGLFSETDELTYTAYIIDGEKNPFYDVHEGNWAEPYIKECFDMGLMNGTGNGAFSQNMNVSRAQMVTTLWRLAGSPVPEGENTFVDVPDGQWYTDAVTWAAENGITSGVGGSYFAPDRDVTRGEVAAIIYRYASAMGEDVAEKADLSSFADAGELTDWNRDAFAWCVSKGIITGKTAGKWEPIYLASADKLSRAELAAVLCRY